MNILVTFYAVICTNICAGNLNSKDNDRIIQKNVTKKNVNNTMMNDDNMTTTLAPVLNDTTTCNILYENCTVNNTIIISNNTIKSNTTNKDIEITTISPKDFANNTVKKDGNIDGSKKKFRFSKRETCSCNLKVSFCDINCCCDEDCTYENKLIFSKCFDEPDMIRDTRFCKYVEYIYKNNTPYEWDVNQNGLFCIAKYNMPKTYVIQKKQILKTAEEGLLQRRNKYIWTTVITNKKEILLNISKEMLHGDIIWMLNNYTNLTHFQLPTHFSTSSCLNKKDILYLNDFKTRCHLNYIDEENDKLAAKTYFQNLTIIAAPKLYNITLLKEKHMVCPRNICLPIEAEMCENNFENCSNFSKNDSRLKPKCQISIYNDEVNCINLVQNVKYVFYHNGTDGFKKIYAKIILANFTHKLSDETINFSQEYECVFLWLNHIITFSSQRSGNPGYLTGKPILIANLFINESVVNRTDGNGTEKILEKNITRNPFNFVDNFLTIPISYQGLCILNNHTNAVIEFHINSLQKCKLRFTLKINTSQTANETCRLIQSTIFNYWSVPIKNTTLKMIGNFGNANIEQFEGWSEVIYYIKPYDILSNITGHYSIQNTSITCHNITTNIKIDVFHSRVVYKNLNNQEKIIGTIYDFVGFMTLEFSIHKNEAFIELPIRHEVMFFDMTVDKVKKYADPPTFQIILPYDFFYPFIKVNNGSEWPVTNILIILILSFFVTNYV